VQILTEAKYPAVTVKNLGKRFKDVMAINDLSFAVPAGSTFAIVGPSGCGKTTLLRLIAGLEQPDWGEIWFGGRMASSPAAVIPPGARQLNMVFQDLALWPHMTIRQHIAFSLPPGKYKGQARRERIKTIINLVKLTTRKRYPHQLSGGEQQRLAIARALASEPRILLLDEPLSNLDYSLKQELLAELKRLIRQVGITALYVTHQPDEVIYLADSVLSLSAGSLQSLCTIEQFTCEQKEKWDENIRRLSSGCAGRIIPLAVNASGK